MGKTQIIDKGKEGLSGRGESMQQKHRGVAYMNTGFTTKTSWQFSREVLVFSAVDAVSLGCPFGEKINFNLYFPPYTKINLW